MSSETDNATRLVLAGLDGSRLVGFLAALGTLRTASRAWPRRRVQLAWKDEGGGWRPEIIVDGAADRDTLVEALDGVLAAGRDERAFRVTRAPDPALDDLDMAPETLRGAIDDVFDAEGGEPWDADGRTTLDFLAALACDGVLRPDKNEPRVADTALRTMSGAGHQHFLGTIRNICATTTRDHVDAALFERWTYADPVKNLSLRWDPLDDRRYAHQWTNPSQDPMRSKRGSVLGAQRLAIEAMALMPTMPAVGRLLTTGFITRRGRGRRETLLRWPIWSHGVTVDVARSLLGLPDLRSDEPLHPGRLRARGISAVFQARRITIGKFRNFTPSEAVLS